MDAELILNSSLTWKQIYTNIFKINYKHIINWQTHTVTKLTHRKGLKATERNREAYYRFDNIDHANRNQMTIIPWNNNEKFNRYQWIMYVISINCF